MGVYKEGKNWKVQVYYKDWQGNRKRKQKRGFRTKGEAKEWERDFLAYLLKLQEISYNSRARVWILNLEIFWRFITKIWMSVSEKTLCTRSDILLT